MKRYITILLFIVLLPYLAFAGTAGKIKGKVTDLTSGEPLIGANVLVIGYFVWCSYRCEWKLYHFQIFEAGTYQVRASFVGYQTVTYSNIRVNADLDYRVELSSFQVKELSCSRVNVIAEKPLVNKSSTNANRITTSDVLDALPR
ncbi:MAG: carboxypeptidase-like regulatory domain-containing protein [Ignavibacteriales bacterium]|nr:carboxypeptidase-like regulatory domain-containing protein [Ignavibacteriales bacterium]